MGHDPRTRVCPAARRLTIALVSACAAVGCSLVVDADRPQCSTDADCWARGFGGAVCVESLCQNVPEDVSVAPRDESSAPRDESAVPREPGDAVAMAPDASNSSPAESAPIEDSAPDAGADPEWGCLRNFQPPSVADGALVSYRLRFERGRQANVPPEGLTVRLCNSDDATCAEPGVDIPEPDAAGLLTLELPPSFRGYLEVDATDHMPSLAFLPPRVVSPPEPQIIRLIERFDFEPLLATTGIPYDPARGFAFALTNSCLDRRAAGVVLSSLDTDEQTAAFYYRDGQPDPQALQTDARGAGGWSLLPAGTIVAEARRSDTLEFIGTVAFESRPGFISYVPIGPTSPP